MPRRTTHEFAGVSLGLLTALVRSRQLPSECQLAEAAGGMFGGWLGGVLPDVIEPATSPNHRQFAHSLAAGAGVSLAWFADAQATCREQAAAYAGRANMTELSEADRSHARLMMLLWHFVAGAAVAFVVGYGSHLALDAMTSKGIPLIGR